MFRVSNGRFEEKRAQVLGISCDSQPAHRTFSTSLGNIPYPLLSDFHPKGEMVRSYGLWSEQRGTSNRAVVVVDKDGIVRFKKDYGPPELPDIEEILAEVDKLG